MQYIPTSTVSIHRYSGVYTAGWLQIYIHYVGHSMYSRYNLPRTDAESQESALTTVEYIAPLRTSTHGTNQVDGKPRFKRRA
jgi:hypothetical protein